MQVLASVILFLWTKRWENYRLFNIILIRKNSKIALLLTLSNCVNVNLHNSGNIHLLKGFQRLFRPVIPLCKI